MCHPTLELTVGACTKPPSGGCPSWLLPLLETSSGREPGGKTKQKAQSLVVDKKIPDKHADYLRVSGTEWTAKHYACNEMPRFGNDDSTVCTTSTATPVNFAGETGHPHAYASPGNMPFLVPCPSWRSLGWLRDEQRWAQGPQRNARGRYLLDLAEDPLSSRRELRKPSFAYAAPDDLRQSPHGSLWQSLGDRRGDRSG